MQASRNGSDIWLSYWVSQISSPQLRSNSCDYPQDGTSKTHSHPLELSAMQRLQKPPEFQFLEGSFPAVGSKKRAFQNPQLQLHAGVAFYLNILLLFAACNAIFTLVRWAAHQRSWEGFPNLLTGCSSAIGLVNSEHLGYMSKLIAPENLGYIGYLLVLFLCSCLLYSCILVFLHSCILVFLYAWFFCSSFLYSLSLLVNCSNNYLTIHLTGYLTYRLFWIPEFKLLHWYLHVQEPEHNLKRACAACLSFCFVLELFHLLEADFVRQKSFTHFFCAP